jgi:hypothetical protein
MYRLLRMYHTKFLEFVNIIFVVMTVLKAAVNL